MGLKFDKTPQIGNLLYSSHLTSESRNSLYTEKVKREATFLVHAIETSNDKTVLAMSLN